MKRTERMIEAKKDLEAQLRELEEQRGPFAEENIRAIKSQLKYYDEQLKN